MIASLAVVEAIERACGAQATIKWPNDVLIADRKVCGILIETSHDKDGTGSGAGHWDQCQWAVPGRIEHKGVEVELAAVATTLETACGHPVSREEILTHLLAAIEKDYLALQQEAIEPPVVAPLAGPVARFITRALAEPSVYVRAHNSSASGQQRG